VTQAALRKEAVGRSRDVEQLKVLVAGLDETRAQLVARLREAADDTAGQRGRAEAAEAAAAEAEAATQLAEAEAAGLRAALEALDAERDRTQVGAPPAAEVFVHRSSGSRAVFGATATTVSMGGFSRFQSGP
jgi:multidrug efflux pump subunit AcrA (membrane-fusion protein)